MSNALSALWLLSVLCLTGCSEPLEDLNVVSGDSGPERSTALQIAVFESGLRPRYGVKGVPAETWSLADRMRHYQVPGVSVAVAIDGELAWAKGYGTAEVGGDRSVDTATLFQAASLSKPVASLTALKLVEGGQLALDEPISSYLTSWEIPQTEHGWETEVTARQLMSHRAGTTVHGFVGYRPDGRVPTVVQILDGVPLAETPPVIVNQRPGASYRYSGGGFTILQLAIEDVTGARFADVAAREVLGPAGMERSHFEFSSGDANFAVGHVGSQSRPIEGSGLIYPQLAAAGLWTTPSELVRLGMMVASARNEGDRFLDRDLARQIVPMSLDDPGLGFGLNNDGDGLAFVHSGHNPGYSARWITYADGRASVAVLTNSDTGGDLVREIFSALGYLYGWRQDGFIERATVELSTEWVDGIVGSYSFSPDDENPVATISVEDGVLWIEGEIVARTPFYPASRTNFFVTRGLNFAIETDSVGNPVALDVEGEFQLLKID